MGWVKGLEPSTPGTTIRCSNQLSYTHRIEKGGKCVKAREKMARQKGFEPLAYCLEGSCSIQLSYWRRCGAGDENRTRIPSLEGWCPGHCATPASLDHRDTVRTAAANRHLRHSTTNRHICQECFSKILKQRLRLKNCLDKSPANAYNKKRRALLYGGSAHLYRLITQVDRLGACRAVNTHM